MKRRLFIATSISSALAACSPIGTALNNNETFHKLLGSTQSLNRAVIGTRGIAREYTEADISPEFPFNSLPTPSDAAYMRLAQQRFAAYRLTIDGAVERRASISLSALKAMPQITQITRHDCVEGWSAIGKWSGVRLSDVLKAVRPRDDARYVVFHCMDRDDQGTPYYESLDLVEAMHPQTLLALSFNGEDLTPDHGAPVRLRVPTQLGYKSAKWVQRIEFVGTFATLYAGNGGYWEDQGYEWYAGI